MKVKIIWSEDEDEVRDFEDCEELFKWMREVGDQFMIFFCDCKDYPVQEEDDHEFEVEIL